MDIRIDMRQIRISYFSSELNVILSAPWISIYISNYSCSIIVDVDYIG